MGYLLGIDLGSSAVKASLLSAETGACVASAFFPETEQPISSPHPGFAEQDPAMWYENARAAVRLALQAACSDGAEVQAIGIAYQMHGLVCVDREMNVLRPAIIWCDSRAVPYGKKAFEQLGAERCLSSLLNSPGNFTAAKFAWVKENEPEIYAKTDKIMLPGDWLVSRLTGLARTTASGLSEGIFWDFQQDEPCGFLLDSFGFDQEVLPDLTPTFGVQGVLTREAADAFGLKAGIPVSYRGGDQPNNALSLNVLEPGEIAATAGTSGVVYGVTDRKRFDPQSRVNTFLHLNHTATAPRLGVLLCINGAGIMNAWTRRLLGGLEYAEMNRLAATVTVGAEGVRVLPFGNGAERVLGNANPGARILGLDLNRHGPAHLCRAVQEGVAFSFIYGMEVMREAGIEARLLRAGATNMFLSDIFSHTLAGAGGVTIELYNTDGALGAARGAGIGAGVYPSFTEAFATLAVEKTIAPERGAYGEAYVNWKSQLLSVTDCEGV